MFESNKEDVLAKNFKNFLSVGAVNLRQPLPCLWGARRLVTGKRCRFQEVVTAVASSNSSSSSFLVSSSFHFLSPHAFSLSWHPSLSAQLSLHSISSPNSTILLHFRHSFYSFFLILPLFSPFSASFTNFTTLNLTPTFLSQEIWPPLSFSGHSTTGFPHTSILLCTHIYYHPCLLYTSPSPRD